MAKNIEERREDKDEWIGINCEIYNYLLDELWAIKNCTNGEKAYLKNWHFFRFKSN